MITAGKGSIIKSGLSVKVERFKDIASLRDEWQALEKRSNSEVFLTWKWVGTWLSCYGPEAYVIQVYQGPLLIALGLIVRSKEYRHKVIPVKALRLNQIGDPKLDQIWIEYNGLLTADGYDEVEAFYAVQSHLRKSFSGWDEITISAIDRDLAEKYSDVVDLQRFDHWRVPYYGVDLTRFDITTDAQIESDYFNTLSKNTRYQIRRSKRAYEERGALTLERPKNVHQALAFFDRIGPDHIRRWGDSAGESGFTNPDFVRFHHAYIEACWPHGVDIVAVRSGDQDIALFYNLINDKTAYFYLCGLKLEEDNKIKPGLLGHALCIEDYARRGFRYYDFMGGEARYKESLGELRGELVQVSLQRNRLKMVFGKKVRSVRTRVEAFIKNKISG